MTGEGVSVVICAKNEVVNLKRFLPPILNQRYNPYEVIVVDDWSTDETSEVLSELVEKHPNLRSVKPRIDKPGKKYALSVGVSCARFDNILVTDADCVPISSFWIAHMMQPINAEFDITVGVAPFTSRPGLIPTFAAHENIMTYLQYSSAILLGRPYMAVGRNLAYRKHLFQDRSEDRIIGGDDDLMLNSVLDRTMCLVNDRNALMLSDPPIHLLEFLQQKRRHVSTSWHYTWASRIRLSIFAATHWASHLGCIYLLLYTSLYPVAFGLWIIRALTMIYILQDAVPMLRSRYFKSMFIVDLLYIFYYPLLAVFLISKPSSKW